MQSVTFYLYVPTTTILKFNVLYCLLSGQGCRICPNADPEILETSHTYASRDELQRRYRARVVSEGSQGLQRLLFEKTVAKVAAYRKHGCGSLQFQATHYTEYERVEKDAVSNAEEKGLRGYKYHDNKCKGRLIISYDADSKPFVQ